MSQSAKPTCPQTAEVEDWKIRDLERAGHHFRRIGSAASARAARAQGIETGVNHVCLRVWRTAATSARLGISPWGVEKRTLRAPSRPPSEGDTKCQTELVKLLTRSHCRGGAQSTEEAARPCRKWRLIEMNSVHLPRSKLLPALSLWVELRRASFVVG
jgi:hypothetical protein